MVLKFLGDTSRWIGGWPSAHKSSTGFGPRHVLVMCETRTLTFMLPWLQGFTCGNLWCPGAALGLPLGNQPPLPRSLWI